jgi:hypothetical protein
VAFKWVADNWPQLTVNSHVGDIPTAVYLDGQQSEVMLKSKIRFYDKAAHLSISELPLALRAAAVLLTWHADGLLCGCHRADGCSSAVSNDGPPGL